MYGHLTAAFPSHSLGWVPRGCWRGWVAAGCSLVWAGSTAQLLAELLGTTRRKYLQFVGNFYSSNGSSRGPVLRAVQARCVPSHRDACPGALLSPAP